MLITNLPLNSLTFDLKDGRLGGLHDTNVDQLVNGQRGVELHQHLGYDLLQLNLSLGLVWRGNWQTDARHDEGLFISKVELFLKT